MLDKRRLYKAFISYSHAADERLAPALQSGLQQLAKPWYRLRALRLFRDKTNLSVTPALWPSIEKALEQSEFLVYLASPQAAQSKWVLREIEFWLDRRSQETLLIALTDGDLVWAHDRTDFDWERTSCLPQTLKERFAAEPLWLDLRWARRSEDVSLRNPRFRDEVATLAATLHGRSKDELVGEDIRQHRRLRLVTWAAAAALFLLSVSSAVAAWIAASQRDSAVRNLARSYLEAGARAYAERDVLAAESSYVKALNVRDDLATRERLLEVRSHGMSLRWEVPGAAGAAIAASTADRRWIALGHPGRLSLYDVQSGERAQVLPVDGLPTAIVFDEAGRRVAVGNKHGRLEVWDLAERRRVADLQAHDSMVEAIAFLPGAHGWLSVGCDNRVKRWASGRTSATWSRSIEGSALTRAEIVSGTAQLLLGNVAGQVRMEPLAGGRPTLEIAAHGSPIGALALSADGRLLATWGNGRGQGAAQDISVKVWRTADTSTPTVLAGQPAFPSGRSLVFSDDGARLFTGKIASGFDVWNTETGQNEVAGAESSEAVRFLAPLAGGNEVITVGSGIAVFDLGVQAKREIARGHGGSAQAVATSPDGRSVVSASFDGTLRVWDLATGRHRATWLDGDKLHDVRISPDGRALASCGSKTTLRTTDTGSVVWSRPSLVYPIRGCLAFDPDGSAIYAATSLGSISVLSTADGQETASIPLPGKVGNVGPLDAAGGTLAVVASDSTVLVLTLPRREVLAVLSGLASDDRATSIAVSPDGSRVAVATRAAVYLWALSTATTPRIARVPSDTNATHDLQSIAFTPDGLRLLTTGHGEVSLWDASTLRRLAVVRPKGGRTGWLNGVAVAPDGRSVVTSDDDGTVDAWLLEESDEVRTFRGRSGRLLSCAWSPDGRRIAAIDHSGADRSRIVVFDDSAAHPILALDSPGGEFSDVTFDETGNRLFAGMLTGGGEETGAVRIFDITAGRWLGPAATMEGPPRALACRPGGAMLAAAGGRGEGEVASTVVLLEATSLRELGRLDSHTRGVETLRFSADGRHLWSGALDSRAIEWTLEAVARRRELPLHGGTVAGLAVSADRRWVATASRDGSVRAFDGDGNPLHQWFAHRDGYGYAEDVDFSPDSAWLASAGGDGQAILWRSGTWNRTVTLRGHEDPWIQTSRFDRTGRRLLTRANEGWLKVWDLDRVKRFLSLPPSDLAVETTLRTGGVADPGEDR